MNELTGQDWFDGEIESISKLTNEHEIKQWFPTFQSILLSSVSNNSSGGRSIQFGAELDRELKYKKKPYKLYLSIELRMKEKSNDLSNSSCSVVILDAEANKISRRFHIDYEHLSKDDRTTEPKPSFHHQQFGRLRDEVFKDACRENYNNSDHWFEKPRLFSLPMPFLVILHWIFREFEPWNKDSLGKIVQSKRWLEAVRIAEEKLMLPHLENWVEYCRNPDCLRDDSNCKTFVDRLYLIP